MGVEGLGDLLKASYPEAFNHVGKISTQLKLGNVDALYFDLNNMIHPILRKSESEEQYINQILTEIGLICGAAKAPKLIFFSLDGAGPRAKLQVQRARRIKSARREDAKIISSLQLTVGSHLLQRIKHALCYFASSNLSKKQHQIEFVISGADRPGEAEYKIFEHIKKYQPNLKNISVVSCDADLVLFALQSPALDKLSILKANFQLGTVSNVDMKILKDTLLGDIPGIPDIATAKKILDDFTLLCLFLGNDYIPKLRKFSLPIIWDLYKKYKIKHMKHGFLYDTEKVINNDVTKLIFQNYKYPYHLPGGFDKDDPDDLVKDYIEAIGWNMDFVKTECKNYEYCYPHKTAPKFFSLVDKAESIKIDLAEIRADKPPLSPIETLLAMIPPVGKHIVPQSFRHLMEPESPVADLWTSDWNLSTIATNVKRLKEAVKSVTPSTLAEHEITQPWTPALKFTKETISGHGLVFTSPTPPTRKFSPIPQSSSMVCYTELSSSPASFGITEGKFMTKVTPVPTIPTVQKRAIYTCKRFERISKPFVPRFKWR